MTEGTEAITTLHFLALALVAALVVVAIVIGVRKQRRRVEAQREVEEHAAEAGIEIASDPSPSFEDAGHDRLAGEPVQSRPSAGTSAASVITPDEPTATIAADAIVPRPSSPADGPVTQLKGLGPKVATRLAELGIDRVGQLAALDDARASVLDAELGPFAGRMTRDRWIEQARLLAAGDRDGFERMFGKL